MRISGLSMNELKREYGYGQNTYNKVSRGLSDSRYKMEKYSDKQMFI